MGLVLSKISHNFGLNKVLHNVDVEIQSGKVTCLLGPSGCGKTTLLRIAAGLEEVQQGSVQINDNMIADGKLRTAVEKRGVGMMFQDFALFPHLSVFDNLAFGLRTLSPSEKFFRINEILEQVNMLKYSSEFPHTLSGGQLQRVALGRALAPRPAVMLLDEPFSGLDQNMRIQIREETLGILKSSGVATLMVTHNPDEALFMADKIIVMSPDGEILQQGSPNQIYVNPAHSYVAKFFGQVNSVSGTVENGKIDTPLGVIDAPGFKEDSHLEIVIRPAALVLKLAEEIADDEGVPVQILSVRSIGQNTFVRFRVKGLQQNITDFHSRQRRFFLENQEGDVRVLIRQEHIFIFKNK